MKHGIVSQEQKIATIRELATKHKDAIVAALPKSFDVDNFLRIFYTTVQKTPSLQDADPRSLLRALIQCGQLGLVPDNMLGQVFLVPFWNSKARRLDVEVIIGYRGYIKLAKNSADVLDVVAHVVYENEPFEIAYGTNETLKHIPLEPDKRGDRKIGAYAITTFRDGYKKVTWMWAEEILHHRELSQSAWELDAQKKRTGRLRADSPWVQWEEDMWCKTVVRKQAKFLPLQASKEYPTTAQAIAVKEEMQELGLDRSAMLDSIELFNDELLEESPQASETTNTAERLKTRLMNIKNTPEKKAKNDEVDGTDENTPSRLF